MYKVARTLFRLLGTFDVSNIAIFHIDTRILSHNANSNGKNGQPCPAERCPGTKVINQCTFALNYCLRRYTAQQQQQQRGSRGYPGTPGSRNFRTGAPNWSFIFDPAGRLCYYWSMVVSLAFLYNFWVIIYRFAFQEING